MDACATAFGIVIFMPVNSVLETGLKPHYSQFLSLSRGNPGVARSISIGLASP
jgi:hypothetical protein